MSKCELGMVVLWMRGDDDPAVRILEDHGVLALCRDGGPPALGMLVKCGKSEWMWSVVGRSGASQIGPYLLMHTPPICDEGRQIAGK